MITTEARRVSRSDGGVCLFVLLFVRSFIIYTPQSLWNSSSSKIEMHPQKVFCLIFGGHFHLRGCEPKARGRMTCR